MALRHRRAPFLGRASELDSLRQAYELVLAGEPGLAVVVGDAGVGKSRLVQEFCATVDATVLQGGCVDLGVGTLPYGPIIEAFRRLAAAEGRSHGPVRRDLTEVAGLLPMLSGRGSIAEGDRAALYGAVLALLERLAATRPVILLVEDVHFADRSTLDLLAFLTQMLRERPVLLVTTVRRDGLEPDRPALRWLSETTRSQRASRIDLAPFGQDEVRAQLTALLGERPDDRLLERVLARSDGNPFFVEELVDLEVGAEGLPPSLDDVLSAQLVRLSPRAMAVLRAAAAVGRTVDHDLLAKVAGSPPQDLLEGLREAVAGHVLVADHRGGSYRFRHALLREAVHRSLLPAERADLHRRIADALTADPTLAAAGPAQAALELAHHWREARDLDRAFAAAVSAGAVAERASAYAEALTHLESVLDLWTQVAPTTITAAPPRYEVLSAASRVAYLAGEHGRSLAHTSAALAELRSADAGDGASRARLQQRLSELQWGLGRAEQALTAANEAVAAAGHEPSEVLAQALGWQSRLSMLFDRHAAAIDPARRAIALARDLGAPVAEGFARNSLGCALAGLGDVDAGVVELREALRLATEADAVDDVIRAHNNLAAVAGWAGRYEDVVAEAQAGTAWAEGRRLRSGSFVSLGLNGVEALLLLGRYDDAATWLAATPLPPDEPVVRAMHRRAAAWLELEHGVPAAAAGRLRQAEELLAGDDAAAARASLATLRAHLELLDGRPEAALAAVETAQEVATAWNIDASPAPAWRIAGTAAATAAHRARDHGQRGVTADVRDRLDALLAAGRRTIAAQPASFLRAALEQAACQLEAERTWVAGTPDPDAFRAARAACADALPPIAHARLLLRLAETCLLVGDRRAAADAAAEALGIGRRIGAPTLERAVVAVSQQGRLAVVPEPERPADAVSPAPFGLTEREREVLALVAEGYSNGEIATALYIAPKTASAHVSNILAKLGVAKRGEASAVAHRLGLVGRDGPRGARASMPR
jgi:DNA-binding CsgD family transcriptional regulator